MSKLCFLAQLFPGRPPVRKLLEMLQEWLASLPLDRVPYNAILDLVNNKMRVSTPPALLRPLSCHARGVGVPVPLRGCHCGCPQDTGMSTPSCLALSTSR